MEEEVWKQIENCSGYEVSDLGRVRSYRYLKGTAKEPRIRNQPMTNKGHFYVILKQDGARKKFFTHRLVARAFVPNPENKPEVNHIDGDKTNNKPENLEWCDRSYNIRHAYHTGLRPDAKLTPEAVEDIRSRAIRGHGGNLKQLAVEYNISTKHIYRVINRENWK